MRTRGLSVVVTGASSGIGREIAVTLARRGCHVWAVARSADMLEDLAGAQAGVVPLIADLTDDADRASIVQATGPVDVLVNNAGIGWVGRVEDMPGEQVRQLFELNVLALIDLTRQVLPAMLERRCGHVVNVASVASWVAMPPLTVYSASKFAVQGFSDGLRRELAGRGVSVATINPGPVATRFGPRAQAEDRPTEDMGDGVMHGVPTSLVARAVVRSIRMAGWPGYATIAVPRALGVVRLGAVPGLRWTVDGLALASRRPALYRRFGHASQPDDGGGR